MLIVRNFVGRSPIQGNGVFAGENIRQGTVIWRIDPRFDIGFDMRDLEALPEAAREFLETYSYPWLGRAGKMLLNVDNSRFMNHCEHPNTDFRPFDYGTAIRDIAEGEEITCNYGEFNPAFSGVFNEALAGGGDAAGPDPLPK
ncbi:MAG: SET domain-containing protein [Hyphomicrobiales bacterium]